MLTFQFESHIGWELAPEISSLTMQLRQWACDMRVVIHTSLFELLAAPYIGPGSLWLLLSGFSPPRLGLNRPSKKPGNPSLVGWLFRVRTRLPHLPPKNINKWEAPLAFIHSLGTSNRLLLFIFVVVHRCFRGLAAVSGICYLTAFSVCLWVQMLSPLHIFKLHTL